MDASPRRIGQTALDFEMVNSRGQTESLAAFRGRWLLLVFHRHLA